MAVTRLKRKAKRNKVRARVRKETIQRLNRKPVLKMVDVEKIKEGFAKNLNDTKVGEDAVTATETADSPSTATLAADTDATKAG